ncbi:MAG TPA: ATP-dependent zinc metalloprotease FtsH [Spirochaetota bacterium]|nr:ATP-dependent zinc metalloprotease FtsH [Spirochaetota bacterium]HOM38122.1 ATP-dependent zinc metalloprotease FtsH [Spirochaetota bacterium]HPQ48924.1 ATP-dependent zinc metalloprotease FtsH [Spirochaetota bacterium]
MAEQNPNNKQKPNTNFVVIILFLILAFSVFVLLSENPKKVDKITYSQFLKYVDGLYEVKIDNNTKVMARKIEEDDKYIVFLSGEDKIRLFKNEADYKLVAKITSVKFKGVKTLEGQYLYNKNNKSDIVNFVTYLPFPDPFLIQKLEAKDIEVNVEPEDKDGWLNIVYSFLPYIVLFGVIWFLFFRQVNNTNNKAFTFVKSRARLYKSHGKRITFKDVAGVEEAKEELKEIIDFLKEPGKFISMGARIPKGVLLVGPPGTGKTLLARAVAGEANRPFYSISGSEFVEMFVGVGASRVRDLFETAKKDAPCIVFIDELDAVGRHRGAGLGGGNDEREQTLNQILVEMDGFDNKDTVIVIAATNRPDILDPALLRPGRFDRQVVVDRPDIKGREEIIKIHLRNKPISNNVNVETIAKGTPGFSGADLENMVNEATLIAARKNKKLIEMEDFEEARDKVLMGPERKSRVMSDEEKKNTAYHEAGHAIVSHFLPEADPLHKITIIPRGRALGITQHLPEKDKFSYTKKYLLSQIKILLGGRIAEEIWFGNDNITTGAANDIERATELARSIVCKWGMSDKFGPITYGKDDSPIFIGKELARYKDYSEHTAMEIDDEVKKIISEQYNEAKLIIENNKNKVEELVSLLLEKETLQTEEIESILGKKIKE